MAISFEKVLRFTSLGALFAALLVPLYVSGELFFPFISGKNFAFRILIEIAFAAWLVLAFRNPSYRPRKSWLMWSILFFVAALGVSVILAEDPYKSFWSNFERMEGFIGIAHFALAPPIGGGLSSGRLASMFLFSVTHCFNSRVFFLLTRAGCA